MTAQKTAERVVGAAPLGDEGDDAVLAHVRSLMTDEEYRGFRRGIRLLGEALGWGEPVTVLDSDTVEVKEERTA